MHMNTTGDSRQPLYLFERAHELGLCQMRARAVEDAEPTKRRKRRPSILTRIRQAQRAGLTVAEIRPDGTLVIGKPGDTKSDDKPNTDEWDGVLQ